MFSVLNINKPQGMTSHDVIWRVRRCVGIKKVGHAGTLDPMATGVLPVCVGSATRLLEYFPTGKSYQLDVLFGIATDTLDADGSVTEKIESKNVHNIDSEGITVERIQSLCDEMVGTIEQKIPLYSAKKVKGKKLYEMARAGQHVEAPTKTVTIHQIQVHSVTCNEEGYPVATIDVDCGTGTFMRAIARDLGEAVGCGAHLTRLLRTKHGVFSLEQSVDLETLMESEDPGQYFLSPLDYLTLPFLTLASQLLMKNLCNGQNLLQQVLLEEEPLLMGQLRELSVHNNDMICIQCASSQSVVIAQWKNHAIKPHKVLHDVLSETKGLTTPVR